MESNINETRSVLIVDDDEIVLDLLKTFFKDEGYRTETAMNGEAALALVNQSQFDIMITDILMPGMNGLELTVKVKEARPAMIVIIMTGFLDEFSYDSAVEAGAADFIKKPFTLQEVMVRIKQAEFHKEMHERSMTDELTGLYNRRGFFALLNHLLKIMKREDNSFSLLYVDIDKFKPINDTWGHKEGDAALIELAGVLKSIYRESDVIARIGGDEFVVAPIRGDQHHAETLVARLQSKIEEQNAKDNRCYKLSVSTGQAYCDTAQPCSIEDLLAEADKAMYEAKKNKHTA